MTIVDTSSRWLAACALFLTLGWLAASAARASDAEIVQLVGKGDARESADADWQPAVVKQKLAAGSFVRTREMSQMALLMKDQTQLRLNQLSILNIKSVATPGKPPTRLELPQGRAWAQAKQRGPQLAGGERVPVVEVQTPGGLARIRGTDWELSVDKDGTSTITVLSGAVDFANEHGSVSVAPNEQARAVPGRAPTKILLTTAAERVQWVTAYRPQPRRWVKEAAGEIEPIVRRIEKGEHAEALEALRAQRSPAAALLRADMHLFLGEPNEALAILAPHAAEGEGDSMAVALASRALLVASRVADAQRLLERGTRRNARHAELLLSRAEAFRLQGDAQQARDAARAALAAEPENAEAWFVMGRIETEREFASAARDALRRALALRPDGPGYRGELATLETFVNDFRSAEAAFREALEAHPDDYVALTGLGVLQLKRGDAHAALESFLRAGTIESRYSRAWLFSAVAWYQLGDRGRAIEAFDKAAQLDDKDPLPHLFATLVHYDSLDLSAAIEAARRAQVRMPFLKSLNQVLNDQKGSANLGAALAAFGLEEWSRAYAHDAYNPFWAGSHLFLADRFAGTFNRNSELYKGYLTDPVVFGASNRQSALVPVPGHYASVSLAVAREYVTDTMASLTLNGYGASAMPFAYSVGFDRTDGDSAINDIKADGRMRARGDNVVLGLGARPTHELGVFLFGNATRYKGRIEDRASGITGDDFSYDYDRFDLGLNYRFGPANQAWLKLGRGSESVPLAGEYFSQDVADTLNTAFATNVFNANGRLNEFRWDSSLRDVQWRHSFDAGRNLQLSWGLEYARETKPFRMNLEFLPVRISLAQDNRLESRTAYVSAKLKVSDSLDVQLDLHREDSRTSFATDQSLEIVNVATVPLPPRAGSTRERETNPRLGLRWRPSAAHTLRFAAQVWRKPAGVGSLAPVDTVGIPVDDRIEHAGGRLKRIRLQHEIQHDGVTFVQWFVDAKRVRNRADPGGAIVEDIELDQLERLRGRRRSYTLSADFLEDTPDFGEGRAEQLGVSVNRLLTRGWSTALRYVYSTTRNTGAGFEGRVLPYHPRHYVNAALAWQPRARWVLGPMATWRSARYRDEDNLEPLRAGWSFGLFAYWESEDKRVSLAAAIDHVHSSKRSSIYRHPTAQVQAAYRF